MKPVKLDLTTWEIIATMLSGDYKITTPPKNNEERQAVMTMSYAFNTLKNKLATPQEVQYCTNEEIGIMLMFIQRTEEAMPNEKLKRMAIALYTEVALQR